MKFLEFVPQTDDIDMERIERFYDPGSGVEVVSRPGEGTCVTLRLCGAATELAAIAEED